MASTAALVSSSEKNGLFVIQVILLVVRSEAGCRASTPFRSRCPVYGADDVGFVRAERRRPGSSEVPAVVPGNQLFVRSQVQGNMLAVGSADRSVDRARASQIQVEHVSRTGVDRYLRRVL